jgi:DNA-binding Lrp family transcriptional regulator
MLNQPNIDDEVSQIDEINLKIINILKKDSSTPFVDVAKQIGVSDATVHM